MAGPQGSSGFAGLGKVGQDPGFNNFNAKYNKGPGSVGEYVERQGIYHANTNTINEHNRKNIGSSNPNKLVLEMNWTGDLTPEEYGNMTNLDNAAAEAQATSFTPSGGLGGRMGGVGVPVASTIDHFEDGFMHPVKDQGSCGSCWTFSANTTLEGTLAKKQGTSPVRISEQQIVDCTNTKDSRNKDRFGKDYGAWGCEGGWMDYSWNFHKDQGYMYDSDYSYTSGNDGREKECAHKDDMTKGRVTSYGQITTNTNDMKAKAMMQPLAVALDAGKAAFQFYKSGVVKASDGCGSQLNHAVVIVGYSSGDDSGPDPSPEPTPPTPTDCTVTKWWHSCEASDTDDRRML